jgi:hypothetical protein
MTTPARKKQPQIPNTPKSAAVPALQGAVGTNTLQQSTAVSLAVTLSSSTPGLKFEGKVSRESSLKSPASD